MMQDNSQLETGLSMPVLEDISDNDDYDVKNPFKKSKTHCQSVD